VAFGDARSEGLVARYKDGADSTSWPWRRPIEAAPTGARAIRQGPVAVQRVIHDGRTSHHGIDTVRRLAVQLDTSRRLQQIAAMVVRRRKLDDGSRTRPPG